MLSYTTKERLATLFELLSQNEQKIEAIRQVLAEISSFNPMNVFNRLDLSSDGLVSSSEIVSFLYENNVTITRAEGQHVLDYFNVDSDLLYNRFLQIVLPRKNSFLKNQVQNRCISAKNRSCQVLPYEQEWALTRFFQQALKNWKSVQSQKEYLFQSLDFTIRDAFCNIDLQDKGYITLQNLEFFQAQNRHTLKFEAVTTLLELFDQNHDGRIHLNEFASLLDPNRTFDRNIDYYETVNKLIFFYYTIIIFQQYQQSLYNKHSIRDSLRNSLRDSLRDSLKGSLKESRYLNAYSSVERASSPLKQSTIQSTLKQSAMLKQSTLKQSAMDQDYKEYLYKSSLRQDKPRLDKSMVHSRYDSRYESPKRFQKDSDLDQLFWTFKQAILDERAVEEAKDRLAQRSDFNSFDAFRVFDLRGCLQFFEFVTFLRDFGIYEDEKSVQLLFNKLDTGCNGSIEFSEFQALIEPLCKQFQQCLKENRPQYIKSQLDFSTDTNRLYRSLLSLQLQKEKHFQDLRCQLSYKYLNKQRVYRYLDNMNKNYLTRQDFKLFLEEFSFFPTQQDIQALFDRFDEDKNGKLSFQEFTRELEPRKSY